jgi:hypothetical protein
VTIASPKDYELSLEDRLAEPLAEAWRPAPGESLIGRVVAVDQRISSYDGVSLYPVVTVRREDGTTAAFHGYHAVAKAELAKQAPRVGERIGIKYIGKRPGKQYEHYRIVVDRDGPAIDWGRIGGEAKIEFDNAGKAAGRSPSTDGYDDIPF